MKMRGRPGSRRLDAMIAETLVDAYGEDEVASAWCTMLEEKLAVPFTTRVLGVEVTVARVEQSDAGGLVAICRRAHERQALPLLDLPLPQPLPDGAEWIEAYRRWARAR